jgi:hypothetical protein
MSKAWRLGDLQGEAVLLYAEAKCDGPVTLTA